MISIADKVDCCGCASCSQCCPVNAINMQADEQGFLYPIVDLRKCIDCGKCDAVCPILNQNPENVFEQKAYLIQHRNIGVLNESSSGGAFTAIAEIVIKNGGVVFGAAYDTDFSVYHKYVESREDLCLFRNSKYVQSNIKGSYVKARSFLDEGRRVCFSGTPCQIEGLINFIGYKPKNLLSIDVVCHAVPSPYVWKTYLELLRTRGIKDIKNIIFRDKDKYGYLYSQFAVETETKKSYEGIETNEMLRAFFSEICNRPSCYNCKFKKRYRRSDITIWDCFDVDEFTDSKQFVQNNGISRALVHTSNGREYADQLIQTCIVEEITPDNALHYDAKEMIQSVAKNERYDEFWDIFLKNPQNAIEQFFPISFKAKGEATLRRILFKIGLYAKIRRIYKKNVGNIKR